MASGWASTVGVVGWSIGGGHGPFCPSLGLGVDNVVAVDVVVANGTLVTASAHSYADLWLGLRGGGGSTWGIITAISVRTYPIPAGGFTSGQGIANGLMCGSGLQRLNTLINEAIFSPDINKRLTDEFALTPKKLDLAQCAQQDREERAKWADYVKIARIEPQ